MRRPTGWWAWALASALALPAQAWQPTAGAQAAPPGAGPAPEPRDSSFVVVPGPFLTKETSWGLGVKAVYSFYPSDRQPFGYPSVLDADAAYTLRNQTIVTATPRLYLDGKNWIVGGMYRFLCYPDRYWGIGNDLPDISQGYTEDSLRWRNEVQRYVGSSLWTGAVHQGRVARIRDEQDVVNASGDTLNRPLLLDSSVVGRDGGLSNGLGLSLLHDSRDHVLLPTQGGYHYAAMVVFHAALGSDFDYLLWTLDLRRFLRLSADGTHVLALQALAELRGLSPPFYELGKLGGPRSMRGYYEGRYRDQHYLTGQAEYRFPIYWRFGGVLFAALGEVFGQDPLRLDRVRWCAGGGLRVRFGTDVIIRLDVGLGPATEAVIIEGGHAF